ncbi:MAG TPA: metallopeptidase TldD-related protein [Acidobacteriaceae bacterium]|nr:metallopeptidase TldD-related protein [Acidobacteriaceae bacterium]
MNSTAAVTDNAIDQQFVIDIVAKALRTGASDAEVVFAEGDEFETLVRLGQVEQLKEAGSRALGLRVFQGQRTASTSTSDLSPEGVEQLISGAMSLVRITSEDPFAGLPEPGEFGALSGDLDLYYEDVYSLPPAERIEYARRTEAAAMAADSRIQNSGGGSFDAATGRKILANSRGFVGESRRSSCSISTQPIALSPDGGMQRDYWYSSQRSLLLLESPEAVGQEAARRTLRRLGARKVPTQKVPLVFAPEVARSILGAILGAINGNAVYRSSSFLAGKLGETVAANNLTIIDDGTIPGGFGSASFDGEGLPTRRKVVLDQGVLTSYLLNTYTARKLGLQSTGNASRGLAGSPGIGAGNFYLEPGTQTPEEIFAGIPKGLYVTELIGHGVNIVTGDYSHGASGLWIENGELTYPVEEITVAGNLKEMLHNISSIGNDLIFRSAVACPTLCIEGMTIAGE